MLPWRQPPYLADSELGSVPGRQPTRSNMFVSLKTRVLRPCAELRLLLWVSDNHENNTMRIRAAGVRSPETPCAALGVTSVDA